MGGLCAGRIVIVTGAGRGLGRAYALAFAREGARVVVNDLGTSLAGSGHDSTTAQAVVQEIRAAGGQAVANGDDVSDWEGAGRIVATALEHFGGLDVVVNNAGVVRDRMFVSATVEEWDATMKVHLRGHFCVSRHAVDYWRACAKQGKSVDARIINTTSGAGLNGSIAQSAYAAAKGGIASLTLVQAAELQRYGITANALAPAARTRMTEQAFAERMKRPESGFDVQDPDNIAPTVVWLGSTESRAVTGCVFELEGGKIMIDEGWNDGPQLDKHARWEPREVGPAVARLLAQRRPPKKVYGT
ncbi:MAG TPA: SDR family oxidoreductase [Steroidobacteraceae bacterium]|nr:SDR family oxidoreductase [Steroidobacteraceae bacterium]